MFRVQGHGAAAGLAHLKQVFDEHLQTHGFLVQDLYIGPALFLRHILLLQQVHIGDDGCQGRLQVMGHICDQL